MSPRLRGKDIPRSTGAHKPSLALVKNHDVKLCTICHTRLHPWLIANGQTTHGEDLHDPAERTDRAR